VSDYESIQRRRNIIVGIFMIVAISALVWLIFKFGDLPSAVSKFNSFEVYVQFPSAPGVQKDTPVQFCGYQIGRVTKVMAPEKCRDLVTGLEYHQTKVALSIDKKYVNIPSNVEIKLMMRGLGSSYVELTVDPTKLPAPPIDPNRPETVFLADGMLKQGSTGMTSEFFPAESQKKFEDIADSLKYLIDDARDFIGDPNSKENLKGTLANLHIASHEAVETMQQAKQTVQEFRQMAATGTRTLQSADAKAEKLVASLINTSDQLGEVTSQLRVILEKANSGDGTVAKLLNDGQLYENMLEGIEQMQLLLEELKSFMAKSQDKGLPIKLK
jgi:phospholipid/cholesterol/gamma-HCH transport system substrate-binding protein